MKTSKRIAALQLIQRLNQFEIDALGRQLNVVRSKMDVIDTQLGDLQSQLDRETYSISVESAPYLAGFLGAVKKQKQFLHLELGTLTIQSTEIETLLMERFIQSKTYEIPLRSAQRNQQLRIDRHESQELDEIGLNSRRYLTLLD